MKTGFSFAVIPDVHLEYPKFDPYDQLIYLWNQWREKVKEGIVGKEIEKRLVATVNLINSIPVEFVMTVGDLTWGDSLEKRLKAKEILNELKIPWVPVLGNHELLPYTKTFHWGGESKGIEYFKEVFKETFQYLSNFFEDWDKPQSKLENYGFTYKGTRFIVVDNVNRRQAPLSKRTRQRLLPQEGKEWLRGQFSREEEIKIVFSHSPLLRGLLRSLSGNKNAQIVNIAGHWHKKIEYSQNSITTFTTDALYLKPVITVVKVLSDGIQFQSVRIP